MAKWPNYTFSPQMDPNLVLNFKNFQITSFKILMDDPSQQSIAWQTKRQATSTISMIASFLMDKWSKFLKGKYFNQQKTFHNLMTKFKPIQYFKEQSIICLGKKTLKGWPCRAGHNLNTSTLDTSTKFQHIYSPYS